MSTITLTEENCRNKFVKYYKSYIAACEAGTEGPGEIEDLKEDLISAAIEYAHMLGMQKFTINKLYAKASKGGKENA